MIMPVDEDSSPSMSGGRCGSAVRPNGWGLMRRSLERRTRTVHRANGSRIYGGKVTITLPPPHPPLPHATAPLRSRRIQLAGSSARVGLTGLLRLRRRRGILASGRRVEVRQSRSHATRPEGATSTRRPGAGHWNAEEDGTVQRPMHDRMSLAGLRRASGWADARRPGASPVIRPNAAHFQICSSFPVTVATRSPSVGARGVHDT